MSTKASNPRCKINFGNLTYRILILQTTWFWLFLQDLGTKSRFSFGTLILQTTWFYSVFAWFWDKIQIQFWNPYPPNHLVCSKLRMILGQNPDSVFGSWSSKPVALQRICMILGLKLDSVFGSWSFKKNDKTNAYKCLQKPLIHDAKLVLEILLFGSWPSKLPGFECFCMILGLNQIQFSDPDPPNHLALPLFISDLHDLGTKSRFSFRILILQTN